MSIQMLKKRFAGRLGRGILYALIATFLITLPLMFGGGGGVCGRSDEQGQQAVGDTTPVAKVNGQVLTRAQYEDTFKGVLGQELQTQAIYAQLGMQSMGGIGVERVMGMRLQALQQAESLIMLLQDAKARGLTVSKSEVEDRINQQVEQDISGFKQQMKGAKPEQLEQEYAKTVARNGGPQTERMSERKFRGWLHDRMWEVSRTELEQQITLDKLKKAVAPMQQLSDAELQASYDQYTVREIQVSLHPAGKPARTEAQAKQRAEQLLAKVRSGADFALVAKTESDDPQAKQTGGLRATPMQGREADPEWQRLVAPLRMGEVAKEPLKMASGGSVYAYAVVKLEKKERKLPADFEKNKLKEMNDLVTQRQNAAWGAYVQEATAKAKIEVVDPEFKGYDALTKGKAAEGLKELELATQSAEKMGPLGAASVFYQLATYSAARNDWKKAVEMYARADDYLSNSDSGLPEARVQTLMGMARANQNLSQEYTKQGRPTEAKAALEEALSWYQAAGNATDSSSYHGQLQQIYTQLGRSDLAQDEQKWLQAKLKEQQERQQALEAQQKAMETQGKTARPAGPSPVPSGKPAAPTKGTPAKPAAPVSGAPASPVQPAPPATR